jgi:hypothetical protein
MRREGLAGGRWSLAEDIGLPIPDSLDDVLVYVR